MGAALVLALVLAAVTAFVWGFVLQEDSRAVRSGRSRVAGLPGRLRHSDSTTGLGPAVSSLGHAVERTSLRVAHGAERVGHGLRSFVEWIARLVGTIRDRRRVAAEERERTARLNFEQTFFLTAPVPGGVAGPTAIAPATAFAEPQPRQSRIVAALELMLLIAIAGGIVAGATFGASHVLAHVLAHLRPS